MMTVVNIGPCRITDARRTMPIEPFAVQFISTLRNTQEFEAVG